MEEELVLEVDSIGSEPAGRRGVCTAVHGDKLYLLGGYPSTIPTGIDVFDFTQCCWSVATTDNPGHRALRTCGSSCVVIKDSLFIFGGWYSGMRHANVYQLDLVKEFTWVKLKIVNPEVGPMCKDKAGMVDYGEDMLCVMGGYGWPRFLEGVGQFEFQKGASYHWDSDQSLEIGWTNELHVYHIPSGVWLSPELSGSRPPPCAAFTFTRVDRHRVVLFGGRQLEERVDHLYILDMDCWHWSGPIIPAGLWPAKCSFHTACTLVNPNAIPCSQSRCQLAPWMRQPYSWLPCRVPELCSIGEEVPDVGLDPKLLVVWGMDNEAEPVRDIWVLNVRTLTWQQLDVSEEAGPPRIWGCSGVFHPVPHEAMVVLYGGTQHNLFKTAEEELIQNVHRASLLHFGVSRSLYHICLSYIAERMDVFSSVICQFPSSVQQALEQIKQQMSNKDKHFTHSCSF